jgi:hypothetical protein
VRVAAALPAVVLGVLIAFTLTVLNGAEREQHGWIWGAEIAYLVLLAGWCLGWLAFASPRGHGRQRPRLTSPVVALASLVGWLIVLGEALQHPK